MLTQPRTLTRTKLSASTLKIYLECPRCFWLHLNKSVTRPRGPFPSLPTGIDTVLKRYFDVYRRQGTLPPLLDGKLQGTLSTAGLNIGYDDETLDARLVGKLDDCLVLEDGSHAPLDHKTRASAPDGVGYTEKYYKFQMDIYSLLLERNGHPISRTAYVVYYFPLEGALHEGFPFGVAIHHIRTDPEGAYAVFQAAHHVLAGPLPASSAACQYCRWNQAVSRSVALA